MPFVIGRAFKLLTAAALPLLAFGFGASLASFVSRGRLSDNAVAFLAGALCFVPVWVGYRRKARFFRRLGFFMTFEHELTHLVSGLLFFKAPQSFRATEAQGGEVRLYGDNFVIALAPYFLPTLALPLLLVPALLRPELEPIAMAALGFAVSYHVFSTLEETHRRQPDIKGAGYLFSAVFLPAANLICYGTILAFVLEGYAGIARLWGEGLQAALLPLRWLGVWA